MRMGLDLGLTRPVGASGPLYGPELIPNGSFTDATGWTLGTATISGGTLNFSASSDVPYIAASQDPSGMTVRITCDVAVTSGSVSFVRLSGGTNIQLVNGPNAFTTTLTAGNSNVGFGGNPFTGTVDNFSMKQVL